ncbi:invasin [Serratia sp. S1B]|nr:invasin [Serratia sp. S1B]
MPHKVDKKTYGNSLEPGGPVIGAQPRKMKIITWINIIVQLLLPLSLSFTPAMVAAASEHTTATSVATDTYTLGVGESVTTVAKKYGISVDELKKLNRYRTFSKPFTALTAGDEIDVPRKSSPLEAGSQPTELTDNKLADYAMTGGKALSSEDATKSAEEMARSAASNKLNDSAQQWLSQFGTARVQLNVDDHAHLDGSSADVLVPLYDNQHNMLFTQLGARNKDSRNTVNAGVGLRTFRDHWMYGVNTFFDDDITGHNQRVGVGAEAWTDYLKLSANSYFALSDWHQSRDFADYNERPADGYDVRAEAYLPAYPQLGGKLMYEQYYGNNVALFGKDHLQKDPHAVTAGINYTPVPLLTLGVEHRMGNSGHPDDSLSLQFNYHLGETWHSHIDPSAVATNRTLAGSRLDLVDRNNDIVLDYQKQEVIHLSMPEELVGDAGSTLMLNALVTAKYGLGHIDWDTAALVAAGGKVQQTATQTLSITLPDDQTEHSYIVGAVAYDTQGNASNSSTVLIKVMPPSFNTQSSTLIADRTHMTANGSDTSLVTLTLRDSNNNPVSGQVVTFTSTLGTVGAVTETSRGVYSATLLAGTLAGQANVTVSVGGNKVGIAPAKVTLTADINNLRASTSSLVASPTVIEANGSATSVVTLTLRDANNNPATGQTVTFATALGTLSAVSEIGNGVYSATLTAGMVVGQANITVSVGGTLLSDLSTSITLKSGMISASNSTLVASPSTIVADNNSASTLTLNLKDANGNSVAGQNVTFVSSLTNSQVGTPIDHGDGTYTALLTGTTAGKADITIKVGGAAFAVNAASVTLTADSSTLSASKSVLAVSPPSIVANGTQTSTLTLTLNDANGNGVSGQTVAFVSDLANSKVDTVTDNGNGTYTATLSGITAGTAHITVTVGGNSFAVNTASVTLTADSSNLSTSKSALAVSDDSIVANGTQTSTLTLTLNDANGNAVSGQTVAFVSDLANSKVGAVTDNGNGTYTATLSGITAGTAHLTVTVGGNAFAVNTASVTLTADSSTLSTSKSMLAVSDTSIVANGTQTSTLTLTLNDANGNGVSGQTVAFVSDLVNSKVGTVTDNGNGTYTATLTGITAGVDHITVTVGGNSFAVNAASVTLTADSSNLSTSKSALAVSDASIVANDTQTSTLTLTLNDANGNGVSGQAVAFISDLANSKVGTVTDNGNGTYTATLSGITAGTAHITVTVGGNAFAVNTASVILTADSSNLSTSKSALAVSDTSIVANGSQTSTLTLTLNDANGNGVSGQTVAFASDLANSKVGTVTDNGNGTYTATLSGTTAGTAAITVTVGGKDFTVNSASVTLTADSSNLSTSKSALAVSGDSIVANGTQTSTLTLTLNDTNGNGVSGQTVAFVSDLANSKVGTVTDNGNGTYTATLSGITAGTAHITVTVGGNSFAVNAASVTLTADSSNLSTSKSVLAVSDVSIVANGTQTSTLTLTLNDANGNGVSGQTVAFAADLANSKVGTVTDNGNGTYTATLSGITAGTAAITVTVGSAAFAVNSASVMLTADSSKLDSTKSTLTANPVSIVANGTATSVVTLTLKDVNDNVVSGQTVTFATSSGAVGIASETVAGSGIYTATLTAGTLAGTANITVEVNGNSLSNTASVTLMADSSKLDPTKSTLTANPVSMVANGTATSVVTLTLKDVNDNTVSGQTVTFATSLGTVGIASETVAGSGIYTATLTAGTLAGKANITVEVNGNTLGNTATVMLNGDSSNLDSTKSTLTANPVSIVANGTATSVVTLTLKDVNDNTVSGQTVTFATSLGAVGIASETVAGSGIYTATLTAGTLAGKANITVKVNGNTLSNTATVTLNGDSSKLAPTKSTLTANPVSIVANGTATSVVTLTLKDVNDNTVSGQTVTFTTSLGAVGIASETVAGSGIYTATLTAGTLAGKANITVKVNGNTLSNTATVTLNGDSSKLDPTKSTLTANPVSIVANGKATSVVTLTLKDVNNNTVSGQTVTFATSLGAVGIASETVAGSGIYTATLTAGMLAGKANITVEVNGNPLSNTATVTLTADPSTAAITALTSTVPKVAVGVVTDSGNNPVQGVTVTFSVPGGSGVSFVSGNTAVTDATGNASINFTTTDAGAVTTLTATVTNTSNQVSSKSVNIEVAPNFAKATVDTQLNSSPSLFGIAGGFPTTGFTNATFQLAPHGNTAQNSNYTWTSSQPSAVTVANTGIVTMAAQPSGEVTITAKWNSDTSVVFTYKFTVKTWVAYVYNGISSGSADIATTNCINSGYARIPTMNEMLLTTPASGNGQRGLGAVWAEWGNLANYPGSGFPGAQQRIWVTTDTGSGQVMVTLGNVSTAIPAILACMK